MLVIKLHNATVTHALKDYEGSVALSPELIELGNFNMHEQVHLWNITQGTRLITYIMEYCPASGGPLRRDGRPVVFNGGRI